MTKTMDCPACKGLVSSEAPACPHCGHPIADSQEERPARNAAAPKKSPKFLWVLVLMILVAVWMVSNEEDAAPPTAVQNSNITYAEIEKAKNTLTDIQFEKLAKGLQEKRVNWTGTVVDVHKSMGDYEALVDQDNTGVQDVYLTIDSGQAERLRKGQKISYAGTITRVSNTLGFTIVRMDDVTVY